MAILCEHYIEYITKNCFENALKHFQKNAGIIASELLTNSQAQRVPITKNGYFI